MGVRGRMAFHAVALLTVLASVSNARADDASVPGDVADVANEYNLNPIDLFGATLATGLPPRTYLCHVGEGPCPTPPMPPLLGAVSRAKCIMNAESGGLDVPNALGSGAWGPGQYMPGTWETDVGLYRRATGFLGPLSKHVYDHVLRVMSYVLTIPGKRTQWTVGGC